MADSAANPADPLADVRAQLRKSVWQAFDRLMQDKTWAFQDQARLCVDALMAVVIEPVLAAVTAERAADHAKIGELTADLEFTLRERNTAEAERDRLQARIDAAERVADPLFGAPPDITSTGSRAVWAQGFNAGRAAVLAALREEEQ